MRSTFAWRSLHFPVGVSSQKRSIPNAVETMRMKGTMKATLHATEEVRPWSDLRPVDHTR